MQRDEIISILNELLGREQEALVPRLFESTVFVSRLALGDWEWARRASRSNRARRATLTELIVSLDGEPAPRRGNLASADLHYQGLHTVLPRIEKNLDDLIRLYHAAAARTTAFPEIATVVSSHLAELESERLMVQSINPKAAAASAT